MDECHTFGKRVSVIWSLTSNKFRSHWPIFHSPVISHLLALYPPAKLYLWGIILFSHCPSIRPLFRLSTTFWFFNILKRQWQNFIKFGKHIDIQKMNIYNRNIRARGQFCWVIALCNSLSTTFWFFLNILNRQWWNFIRLCKHIDNHKMNICIRIKRARGQFSYSYWQNDNFVNLAIFPVSC